MGKKLFIGNLSWNIRNEELRDAFGQFGDIEEAIVIMDRERNRSKGFGFVTFATEEAAKSALEAMDGQDLDGRPVNVSWAIEKQDRNDSM